MGIYRQPQDYGLTEVAKVNKSGYDEDFAVLVVWGDPETGMLYYGEDFGCWCCQSPFMGQSREDMVLIDDIKVFARHAREWGQSTYNTRAKVFTQLGAMMVKIRNFEEQFEIEIPESVVDLDPDVAENDEN